MTMTVVLGSVMMSSQTTVQKIPSISHLRPSLLFRLAGQIILRLVVQN
jgi:hypothetical protein